MDVDSIIQIIIVFAQENMIVAAVIGMFMIFLLFRHPKVLLTVIVFIALAYGVAEFFDQLRSKARL